MDHFDFIVLTSNGYSFQKKDNHIQYDYNYKEHRFCSIKHTIDDDVVFSICDKNNRKHELGAINFDFESIVQTYYFERIVAYFQGNQDYYKDSEVTKYYLEEVSDSCGGETLLSINDHGISFGNDCLEWDDFDSVVITLSSVDVHWMNGVTFRVYKTPKRKKIIFKKTSSYMVYEKEYWNGNYDHNSLIKDLIWLLESCPKRVQLLITN